MALNDVTAAFHGWLSLVVGERRSGSYVNGRWVASAPIALNFKGVIQNATPQDLKVLPEGTRIDEAIKIHTTQDLVAQIEDTNLGDRVQYQGYWWTVYNVADRQIGGYYKALCIKDTLI